MSKLELFRETGTSSDRFIYLFWIIIGVFPVFPADGWSREALSQSEVDRIFHKAVKDGRIREERTRRRTRWVKRHFFPDQSIYWGTFILMRPKYKLRLNADFNNYNRFREISRRNVRWIVDWDIFHLGKSPAKKMKTRFCLLHWCVASLCSRS
jgi:hypothetical protein